MANTKLIRDDFHSFKDNMDGWVRSFSVQLDKLSKMPILIDETRNNTNHNYEIINQLRTQMDELKEDVRTIKLMQVFIMKNSMDKKVLEKERFE